jgi:hypothetical protein
MSGSEFGQNPKKETVYNGPTVATGNAYGAPGAKPVKETVYGGPGSGGTVYGSPSAGGPVRSPASPSAGVKAASSPSGKEANVFFTIGALTLLNALLLSSGAKAATVVGLGITRVLLKQTQSTAGDTAPVFLLSAVLIAVFVALGVFAKRGSSVAFLIGLLLYGADTAVLCLDGIALHIPSIIFHGIFLAWMFKGYRLTNQ